MIVQRGVVFTGAVALLLMLPWLNPFASGPSPGVVPLIFSGVCAAGLFGVCSRAFDLRPPLRLLNMAAIAWLAAGLLSCTMGLFQYFGGGGGLLPWVNQAELGQAFANLRQRNQFASLTNIALAALVWVVASKPISPQKRCLALFAAGLLALGNAASSSRTGLVQLLLLCLLCGGWAYVRLGRGWQVLAVAIATYALATVLLPQLAGFDPSQHGLAARLRTGDDVCSSRLTLWSNVLELIAHKPWLGWGWGELDYAHYVTLYNGPRFCDILDNAHNLPLHLAVELGIPLATLLCGGGMWWVVRQRPWAEPDPDRQLVWSVLAIIALHSLLEYPLWYGPFQIAVGVGVTALWRRSSTVPVSIKTTNSNKHLRLDFPMFVAILLIAFCSYAGWDYHRISQLYLQPDSRSPAYRSDTLAKVGGSWLFAHQVQFAELMVTPLTSENAVWTFETAAGLLHYSPEPRVIEKRIEAAVLLGHDGDALQHLAYYRAAFPTEHARWAGVQRRFNADRLLKD